jgi:hypothetical protein
MKLIIDRSKWLRGEGPSSSCLLRPEDGKMCCLGIYALACGVPKDEIWGQLAPGEGKLNKELWTKARRGGAWLFESGGHVILSRDCSDLMNENDDPCIGGKESKIAKIFAEHGVEVTFVDGDGGS